MKKEIGSDDARRRFRELLDAVERDGEHVTISRWGTPAAVVVPAGWYDTVRASVHGEGRQRDEAAQ